MSEQRPQHESVLCGGLYNPDSVGIFPQDLRCKSPFGGFKTFSCCVYNPDAATHYLNTRKNRKKTDRRWARVMFSSNLSRKLSRKVNRDKEKNDSSQLTLQVSIYCSPCFLPCSHRQPSMLFHMAPAKTSSLQGHNKCLKPRTSSQFTLITKAATSAIAASSGVLLKHRGDNAHLSF